MGQKTGPGELRSRAVCPQRRGAGVTHGRVQVIPLLWVPGRFWWVQNAFIMELLLRGRQGHLGGPAVLVTGTGGRDGHHCSAKERKAGKASRQGGGSAGCNISEEAERFQEDSSSYHPQVGMLQTPEHSRDRPLGGARCTELAEGDLVKVPRLPAHFSCLSVRFPLG